MREASSGRPVPGVRQWAWRAPGASGGFFFGLERLLRNLAVGLLQENLDAALGFFKLLLAFAGELHAFFEKLHGLVERKLGVFEALHHLFEARERALEIALARCLRRLV